MEADLSRISTIMIELHYFRGEAAMKRLLDALVGRGFGIDADVSGGGVALLRRDYEKKVVAKTSTSGASTTEESSNAIRAAERDGALKKSFPSDRIGEGRMSLPSFMCIGAQKAGTSWLYVQLAQHPSIWMPPVKELHYFDHLFVPQNRRWTMHHIRSGASAALRWQFNNAKQVDFVYLHYLCKMVTDEPFTERWYRALFDRPAAKNKVLGDITPEYSTIPDEGIGYVRSLLGAVKLIYIIRDPVDRVLSQLRMSVERKQFVPQTDADWEACFSDWDLLNRGDYRTYIPRWRRQFTDRDVLFVPYRKIGAAPTALMADVEAFIGVDKYKGYKALDQNVHATEKVGVPSFVKTRFAEILKEQIDFLNAEFGKDFTSAI
jgi:hypothetical protein